MEDKMIDKVEGLPYKTRNRFPVVFDYGEGVKLYNTEGTEYLDFGVGITVMALGYHDAEYTGVVQEQVEKLLHTSDLFCNQPSVGAAEKLLAASGMDRVFFTSSGAEAIEGALKIARRYVCSRGGHGGHEIIAMEHSFHGRSIGALSVTGNDHCQEPSRPLSPGVKFAVFSDLDSMKALTNENTCAIITETIQGGGGIYPATEESLRGVQALCDEHDILLILNGIQCDMGRSGSMFTWQEYGVKPDMVTVARVLGNGISIDAFLTSGKAAAAMQPDGHGTTYGGNPLVCVATSKVLDIFEEWSIVEYVQEVSAYLWEKLEEFVDKHDCVVAYRGRSPIQGLEFNCPAAPIMKKALLEQRLILISAGSNMIRSVPPLTIGERDVDLMTEELEQSVQNSEI